MHARVAGRCLLTLTATSLAIYAIRAATGPLAHVVDHVPDDAFYYLVLARNFTRLHRWTTDGGLTVTTGFHALYAWFLTVGYAAFAPGMQAFVRGAVVCGAAASLASLVPAWAHARGTAHGESV